MVVVGVVVGNFGGCGGRADSYGVARVKLTVVLAVLIGILVLACSCAAPATAKPTPNIDATVEAKLAQKRAGEATVQVKVSPTLMTTARHLPSAGLAFIH